MTTDPTIAAVARGLDLDVFAPARRDKAIAAFVRGNAAAFLILTNNMNHPEIVARNALQLRERGMFEQCLLIALTMPMVNTSHVSRRMLSYMIALADRAKLRAAGDSLPGAGPFTVYRGVAGRGAARRVRGYSWTLHRPTAAWFAHRGSFFKLADPAVFEAVVEESDVLAYDNGRQEQELLVLLSANVKPRRCLSGVDLIALAEAQALRHQEHWERTTRQNDVSQKSNEDARRVGTRWAASTTPGSCWRMWQLPR